jgi:hypothetical protein
MTTGRRLILLRAQRTFKIQNTLPLFGSSGQHYDYHDGHPKNGLIMMINTYESVSTRAASLSLGYTYLFMLMTFKRVRTGSDEVHW